MAAEKKSWLKDQLVAFLRQLASQRRVIKSLPKDESQDNTPENN